MDEGSSAPPPPKQADQHDGEQSEVGDDAENREVGDVTTLADSSVMDLIKSGLSKGSSAEG